MSKFERAKATVAKRAAHDEKETDQILEKAKLHRKLLNEIEDTINADLTLRSGKQVKVKEINFTSPYGVANQHSKRFIVKIDGGGHSSHGGNDGFLGDFTKALKAVKIRTFKVDHDGVTNRNVEEYDAGVVVFSAATVEDLIGGINAVLTDNKDITLNINIKKFIGKTRQPK